LGNARLQISAKTSTQEEKKKMTGSITQSNLAVKERLCCYVCYKQFYTELSAGTENRSVCSEECRELHSVEMEGVKAKNEEREMLKKRLEGDCCWF